MRKVPAALLAACLLTTGLTACASGVESEAVPDVGSGGASGADTRVGAPDSPSRPGVPVPIGAQPVPDTPVAELPPHPDHAPIAQPTPQPATPAAQPPPAAPQPSRQWVVSPTGSDTADGSASQPFRTIGKALSVAGPGELIRVLSGTYAERIVLGPNVRPGTPGAQVTLQGEGRPRLIPGPGSGALVQVGQPHWVIDGLELDLQGQAMFAVTFVGNVRGSVLANSELHHGTAGAAVTTYGGATGVTIENNHIHDFVKSTGNQDSHGVVVQTTSRDITVRNNDIHDNSGDSVQCLGPEGFNDNAPARGLLIENNHFYANRENAVDIKTCHDVVIRNNRMHGFKPSGTAKGDAVVVHYSARNVLIEDNEVYDSGKGISVGGNREGPVPSGVVIRRNRVHDISMAHGGEGSGLRLENSEGTVVVNNTIARAARAALVIGHGTGGPTTDCQVLNNLIDSAVAVDAGGQQPGLRMGTNLYRAGAQFKAGGALVDLESFKAAVGDSTSGTGPSDVAPEAPPPSDAVDRGTDVGLPFCGAGPDIGAVESGC